MSYRTFQDLTGHRNPITLFCRQIGLNSGSNLFFLKQFVSVLPLTIIRPKRLVSKLLLSPNIYIRNPFNKNILSFRKYFYNVRRHNYYRSNILFIFSWTIILSLFCINFMLFINFMYFSKGCT